MAQSRIDHRVDSSDARAGQHRNHAFQRERHVDDDPVPLLYSERLQAIGKTADVAMKLAVCNHALVAVFRQPDISHAVSVCALNMSVESVNGYVGARSGEPLVMDAIPLKYLRPGLRPDKSLGNVFPKLIGVCVEFRTFASPVFQQRLLLDDLGRSILFDYWFCGIKYFGDFGSGTHRTTPYGKLLVKYRNIATQSLER